MIYAQLDDNNLVVAVSQLAGTVDDPRLIALPALDETLLGKRYQDGEFVMPEQPAPVPETKITRLAFLSRFTDAEAIALDLASMGATIEAATLRRYMSKVNAASFIDLSHTDTRNGVQALEAIGILDAGRALQILDAPVQDHELL